MNLCLNFICFTFWMLLVPCDLFHKLAYSSPQFFQYFLFPPFTPIEIQRFYGQHIFVIRIINTQNLYDNSGLFENFLIAPQTWPNWAIRMVKLISWWKTGCPKNLLTEFSRMYKEANFLVTYNHLGQSLLFLSFWPFFRPFWPFVLFAFLPFFFTCLVFLVLLIFSLIVDSFGCFWFWLLTPIWPYF